VFGELGYGPSPGLAVSCGSISSASSMSTARTGPSCTPSGTQQIPGKIMEALCCEARSNGTRN
jgi:hypothetical protein